MAADLQAIVVQKNCWIIRTQAEFCVRVSLQPLGQEKMSPEEAEMAEAEELLRAAEEKGGRHPGVTGWSCQQKAWKFAGGPEFNVFS